MWKYAWNLTNHTQANSENIIIWASNRDKYKKFGHLAGDTA
jgi:hypothetical protein